MKDCWRGAAQESLLIKGINYASYKNNLPNYVHYPPLEHPSLSFNSANSSSSSVALVLAWLLLPYFCGGCCVNRRKCYHFIIYSNRWIVLRVLGHEDGERKRI